jgi:branched-chain amino acid transport system permease protein
LPPWAAPLLALAFAAGVNCAGAPLLGDYGSRVLIDVMVAVTLAVSLNIVNGLTGQFSLGHAAFFAIGGYTAAAVTYYASLMIFDHPAALTPAHGAAFATQQMLFVAATLAGGCVAAVAGWFVGLPSLRLRGDYLAMVTLGFGEILRVLLQQTETQLYARHELRTAPPGAFWPPPVGGAVGFIGVPKLTNLFWATLAAGVCVVFAWRLKKSTFGRAMIAVRENEIAAESMGVNVTRLKVWAFVLAAFFAGVAGSLYAHETGQQLTPVDGGFNRSVDVVIMVVLGGLGSISGAITAATLLTIANEWLRDPAAPIRMFGLTIHVWQFAAALLVVRLIAWPHKRLKAVCLWTGVIVGLEALRQLSVRYGVDLGQYRVILYALVLILVMILRPGGLFGTNEITDLPRMRRGRPVTPGRGFEVVSP